VRLRLGRKALDNSFIGLVSSSPPREPDWLQIGADSKRAVREDGHAPTPALKAMPAPMAAPMAAPIPLPTPTATRVPKVAPIPTATPTSR
jgi:hypothetical protein